MQALPADARFAARLARGRDRQSLRDPQHQRARALARCGRRRRGISRFRFYRVFKEVLGTSPGEYFKAVRWQRFAEGLGSGRTVTAAIYDAGYGSVSRAYESARSMLGMTPATRRAGGAGARDSGCVTDQRS